MCILPIRFTVRATKTTYTRVQNNTDRHDGMRDRRNRVVPLIAPEAKIKEIKPRKLLSGNFKDQRVFVVVVVDAWAHNGRRCARGFFTVSARPVTVGAAWLDQAR